MNKFSSLVGKICTVGLILSLFISSTVQAQQTKRMYFIGNSVTDAMNYGGLKSIAESRGNTHTWARLMIPGSPLELLWDSRTSGGFTESPYGNPTNAFSVYQWDILSLQPFDRSIEGEKGDRTMVSNFYNLIKGKSPNCQVFIYARWCRVPSGFTNTTATKEQYNNTWTSTSGNETRKFFEDLTTIVRTDFPATKDNFRMVPIGEVFYALNNNQAFLDAAGLTSIWGVYSDGIHMTGFGSYIAACTMYAMAYHDDPANLGVPGTFGSIPAAALPYIHQTIKEVIVAKKDFTKIDYFGPAPVQGITLNATSVDLNVGKSATLIPTFTPSNAANKNIIWTSLNPDVASISNGTINALTTGSATIKAKTEDGGFEATCEVNVINTGIAVTGIELNKTSTTILVDQTETLTATVLPETATNKSVIWSTSDASVATVNATGEIKGIKKGVATISAITVNGMFTATLTVTVTRPNNPPVAVLKYSPGSFGYAPFKVALDGKSSSDPDPDDFVLGYDWVIKKQGVATPIREESSNGFEHTFTEAGVYEITLQAVDNDGKLRSLNTEKATITVLDMPVVPADEPALCYEGFNYIKAAITNFNGGRGWRGGWNVQDEKSNTETDFAVDNTAPVTIQNLRQTGNYMILGQGYSGCGRGLDNSTNGAFKDYIESGKIGKAGTTLWVSMIIRPQSNNKDCRVSLSDEGIFWLNNTANAHKVDFGCFGSGNWGFSFGYSTSQVKYESTVPVVNNTPAFLVAKIEFGATNKVTLYVNPTPGNTPTGTPIEATTTNSIKFQAIAMNFSNGSNKMATDEIRFGTSYADVAPSVPMFDLTVTNGTGSGQYAQGATVNITANTAPQGKTFDKWTGDVAALGNVNQASTTVTIPASNVSVTATYKDIPMYTVTVTNGTGSGQYAQAATVSITANTAPQGKVFDKWTGDVAVLGNLNQASTTVTVPASNVSVTATYKDIPMYTVTVTNGTGGGQYAQGATVSITANTAPQGKVFDKWTGDVAVLGNLNQASTTMTVPASNVSVTATYKDIPTYTVTVTNGTGGGQYAEGETVTITANTAASGYIFNQWVSANATLAEVGNPSTTFTMPARNVTVEATYSPVTAINDPVALNVTVNPNPATDYLQVNGLNSEVYFRIVSSSGVEVASGQIADTTPQIDVRHLSTGVYLLQLISEDDMWVIRFIKK